MKQRIASLVFISLISYVARPQNKADDIIGILAHGWQPACKNPDL